MQTLKKNQLTKSIAMALGLAFVPAAAFAAGLPGAGTVTLGNVTAVAPTNTGGGQGAVITGLTNADTLTVYSAGLNVVQWGGFIPKATGNASKLAADTNAAGFNVLAGKTLTIAGNAAFTNQSLLNVDASGNPSTIAGTLIDSSAQPVNIYIANANGITVTNTGVINMVPTSTLGLLAGVNLATAPNSGSGLPANSSLSTTASLPISFANATGALTMDGAITGTPSDVILAGSGDVNVNYSGNNVSVFGGTAFTIVSPNIVNRASAEDNLNIGTKTTGVSGYQAANVTVTNFSGNQLYANGNLTIDGAGSVLPTQSTATAPINGVTTGYGWTDKLVNNDTAMSLTDNFISGNGTTSPYSNPWRGTANLSKSGFVETPVGSFTNNALVTTSAAAGGGLAIYANGITNAAGATLRVNPNGLQSQGGLTLYSNNGNVDLAGTVQSNSVTPAVAFVDINAANGNIVQASNLTVTGNSTNTDPANSAYYGGAPANPAYVVPSYTDANFVATASGTVNITGTLGLTDNTASSLDVNDYLVQGSGITIGANQTVSNSNGTNKGQPVGVLQVNGNGGGVTVNSGSTITAGDWVIGGAPLGAQTVAGFTTNLNLVNLMDNGGIVATNTGNTTVTLGALGALGGGNVGSVTAYATNISGTGSMTGQQFNLEYTQDLSNGNSPATSPYYKNGFMLNSMGGNPTVNLLEAGYGHQYSNVMVNGSMTLNASSSTTTFRGGSFLSGTYPAGIVNGNNGSPLIALSSGNITLGMSSQTTGNGVGGGQVNATALGVTGTVGSFWVPGLLGLGNANSATNPTAVNANGTITSVGNVYNDYLSPIAGGQGMYFLTRNLNIGGSLYTNMNSNVNVLEPSLMSNKVFRDSIYQVQYSSSNGVGYNYTNTLNVAPNPYAIALIQ
jgi:hypothetical protein